MKIYRSLYFVLILSLLISLTSCTYFFNSNFFDKSTSDSGKGLYVSGEGKYHWITGGDNYDLILYIYSDNITVSGLAECNTAICVTEGVSEVIFKDLNQNSYGIDVILPMEENWTVDLIYSGKNIVNCIDGCDNLNVKGMESCDELTVTGHVMTYLDLNILEGCFQTEYLEAWGNVCIKGNTNVSVNCIGFDKDETYITGISADKKLVVDLSEGGRVLIKSLENQPPIITTEGIILEGKTVVKKPSDAYIDISDPDFNDEYTIYNADGTFAEEVIIEYAE